MGLASSQARMLLLTAQKSDLEYRAQMINQRKLNLGMRTQELAQKYSKAMSNRKLEFAYYTSGSTATALKQDLTYSTLTTNNGLSGSFLVTDAAGKYVVTNSNVEDVYNKLVNTQQVTCSLDEFKKNNCNYNYSLSLLNNSDFFQDALRNGGLFIQQLMSSDSENSYKDISYSSVSTIYDSLDTSDDDEAQAEYEAQALVLSNQDKQLDLELQQIQTKHKAIETEYDSVKKVIDKNIDKSFKIFS